MSKNIFRYKTFWLNLLSVTLPMVSPAVAGFVALHPAVAAGVAAGVNIVNRVIGTTGPATIIPQ